MSADFCWASDISRRFGLPGMVDDVELINSMQKNFRDNQDQKFKNSP